MSKIEVIMYLDGGVSGTGLSLWPTSHRGRPDSRPLYWTNLYPQKGLEWPQNMEHMVSLVERYIDPGFGMMEVVDAAMEYPGFFDDAGGHMVARSGDLAKLVFFCGALYGMISVFDIIPRLYDPGSWKGQLPKSVVEKRVETIMSDFDFTTVTSHCYDSFGIALYDQGLFTLPRRQKK